MSSPGTLRFGQVATKPSAPPLNYDLIYVKTDDVLYIQDSSGVEVALGSSSSITQLTGDVSATGPGIATATVNSVGGQTASAIAAATVEVDAATPSNTPSTLVLRDSSGNFSAGTITASLNGNASTATSTVNFSGPLLGDVTGTQGATVVSLVDGFTAAQVGASVTLTQDATSSNTASTLILRDASGNFSAGAITANLIGNATTATNATTAVNFTGSLSGDVTGTQSATSISSTTVTGKLLTGYTTGTNTPIVATNSILVAFENLQAQVSASTGSAITALTGDVSATGPGSVTATVNSVGGQTAAAIAAATVEVGAATSSNTASTLVLRNASGNFSAGTITAALNGNATTATTSVNFSGSLSGDVTGTQSATVVSLVGGQTATAVAAATVEVGAATSLNTPGTLVLRDGSGNFSAGTITATLNGNASNITATSNSTLTSLPSLVLPTTQLSGTLQAAQEPAHTGDVTNTAGSLVLNLVATTNSTLTTLSALSLPGSQVTGNISGDAANVTGVVAIANGGTGQTTANAGFDALSPMTTLGDIIYENATPTAARLPGNTTSVREFLTSQGSGGLATAPFYSALVSGDIPNNAANTTGTASNITATTNSTLTTLSALSLPGSQITGNIPGSQINGFTQGSVIFAGASGQLTQDNSNFYWNDTTYNLGLGVIPATTASIDIVNSSGVSKAIQTTSYGTGSSIPFRGRFARGTLGTPAAAQSGDNLSVLSGRGYGASQFATASTGAINIVAGETFTNTSNATYLQFEVTNTGSVTLSEAMRISPAGNLLIGTTTDAGQKLQVNGTALFSNTVTDSVAPIFSSLTGYLYGNGASAVTASTTIPTTNITGVFTVAQTIIPAQAISALNIDWSTGNMFTKTLSANSTFTFSNAISGQTIVIRLTNTASNYTVTWPAAVKWAVQTAPVMTIGAFSDVYTIIYDGTNYYGSYVQNF